MKNIKNTIALLSVILSLSLHAKWPVNSSALIKGKKFSSTANKMSNQFFNVHKEKLVLDNPAYAPNDMGKINTGYVSGFQKKDKNNLETVLNWDFKVKFKLNKNMNILFSYN